MNPEAIQLAESLKIELCDHILPFWINRTVDESNGGFIGQVTSDGTTIPDAPKGAVLNTRILWAFSAAYRILKRSEYLEMVTRARDYVLEHFVDPRYGGIYWSLNADGQPLDMKKQSYAIGFAIYGLSEYHRATGDKAALDAAIDLFHALEEHAYDPENGGYYEALGRDWSRIEDMRLSEKDENLSKTMNTHLHIIEPYTNLYRVWPDARLEQRLKELLSVFSETIVDPESGHLGLFFDDAWNLQSNIVSYGHDIEASWLLHETALVLNDREILKRIEPLVVRIAGAAAEGLQPDGSMIYEYDRTKNRYDCDRHWWVQAETVVGYFNLYDHFGEKSALDRAISCWKYINDHLSIHPAGEWYWSILADGQINSDGDRAGFWKCPYHNSRMCLELIERTGISTGR